jgi:DNA-binding FrmR family transcriptional regulator
MQNDGKPTTREIQNHRARLKEIRGQLPGAEMRTVEGEQERAEVLSSLRDILTNLD